MENSEKVIDIKDHWFWGTIYKIEEHIYKFSLLLFL